MTETALQFAADVWRMCDDCVADGSDIIMSKGQGNSSILLVEVLCSSQ